MDADTLARVFVPLHLIGELTSRCNLRCRYCQKASDSWNAIPGRDEDTAPDITERIFDSMHHLPFRTVQLSGIGEFTFRKDWTSLLDRFRDHHAAVTLISNLARPFSDAELDALLRLEHLMVSIDTMDAEQLKSVRRGAPLAVIIANLVRLRMRSAKTGIRLPHIRLNAVIYLENMLAFEDLAHFAIQMRVDDMQFARMEPQTELRPPHEIDDADAELARAALVQMAKAKDLLLSNNIQPLFHGDLIARIAARAGLQ